MAEPKRFRKKAIEVEAVQLGAGNFDGFFREGEEPVSRDDGALEVRYPHPDGRYVLAASGDWLIRLSDGTLDCCSDVVFEATYEPADQPQDPQPGEDRGEKRFTAASILKPIARALIDPGYYVERRLTPDSETSRGEVVELPEHEHSWQMNAIRVVLGVEDGAPAATWEAGQLLTRDEMQHLLERCTESTNAPKVNGYSCEVCRAIGGKLEAALSGHPGEGEGREAKALAEIREQLQAEVDNLENIRFLADQESIRIGAEGNHLGEHEAKGIAVTARNSRDKLKSILQRTALAEQGEEAG